MAVSDSDINIAWRLDVIYIVIEEKNVDKSHRYRRFCHDFPSFIKGNKV